MCVKLLGPTIEKKYDSSIPLEKQLRDCKEVIIRYEPKDSSIKAFMKEMERICKAGIECRVNVKVVHNNNIRGAQAKRQLRKIEKDLKLNEAIKLLVGIQSQADRVLEELSMFCKR